MHEPNKQMNTEADDAQEIDVVVPIYNLIKYCDNYS